MTISLKARFLLLALASAALLLLAPTRDAAAASWPNRPARWGQSVVVENRPGGDGMVAITAFLGAHDDHVLLLAPVASFTAHPYFHDKLPYDPKDPVPVARISNTVIALSVPTSLKVNSLNELEALARAKPGQLNWTTATGFTDFVFAGFLHGAGLKMAKVPGRGCHRSRRGAHPGLHAGLRHRAAAGI
jgi:tripartite-type tricarboxylate transporter receptor subunit TctC